MIIKKTNVIIFYSFVYFFDVGTNQYTSHFLIIYMNLYTIVAFIYFNLKKQN